ncbi:ribosomal RNA adenine dimethylase family protein [Staphylococcus aureus subsp. aureus CIG1242]|nr:ribosomal RNA adenine dimethylase family protein [Staphylococcus aureus subsp. aureus CIG1242]
MNQKNPKDTQNFITSKKHVKRILNHTNISKQDNVIEIGSGKGHFYQRASQNESISYCYRN